MAKLTDKQKYLIEDVTEIMDVGYDKEITNNEIDIEVLWCMISDLYDKCSIQEDEIERLKEMLRDEKGYDTFY